MNTSQYTTYIHSRSEKFHNVINFCKSLLKTSDQADENRKYIANRVSPFYQNKFEFGFFPKEESLIQYISDMGGKNDLFNLGLISLYNKEAIKTGLLCFHNLIMPIKDDYGNIVALVGRSLLNEQDLKLNNIQKYKYTYGYSKSTNLFGLYHAKKMIRQTKKVIIVEGQIDCISCHAHGMYNTVALGGSSMSNFHLYLLNKYGGKDLMIYLALDNDEAGLSAREKIISRYSKWNKFKNIFIPKEYKDIDQYLHESKEYGVLNELL